MELMVHDEGKTYSIQLREGASLAIPLQFNGQQPNHFGVEPAKQEVLRLGEFVGQTEKGGSCNVDVLQFVPHCNGTHTETVSHIIDEDIWVGHAALEVCCTAQLVTLPIRKASETNEVYRPTLEPADEVITAKDLEYALEDRTVKKPGALVIRTLPNTIDKKSRKYASGLAPAFLTTQAMELIVKLGCQHLLVDLPSVDRMYDDGLLTNHHLFWNVPEGTHRLTADTWQAKTITEMIYVPDDLEDGMFLLSLHIPAFATDAAPSRPILFPFRQK